MGEGNSTRRQLLTLAGSTCSLALAGCAGLDEFDTEDNTDSSEKAPKSTETPGELTVSIRETNSPVLSNELLSVDVLVENVGETQVTDEISLSSGNRGVSETVSLGGGERMTLTLEVKMQIRQNEPQTTVEAVVETSTDSDSAEILVQKPATFELSLVNAPSEVVGGEPFEMTVKVTNTGGVQATTPVVLRVPSQGENPDSTDVTLKPGTSTEVPLSWTPGELARPGEILVETNDDSVNHSLTVLTPANLATTVSLPDKETFYDGESVVVDIQLENTGEATGSAEVEAVLQHRYKDDIEIENTVAEVEGGNEREVTVEWVPEPSDVTSNGPYELLVRVKPDNSPPEVDSQPVSVNEALTLQEYELVETGESFAELIQVTVENKATVTHEEFVYGEILINWGFGDPFDGTYSVEYPLTFPPEQTTEALIKVETGEALALTRKELGMDPFYTETEAKLPRKKAEDAELDSHDKLAIVESEFELEENSEPTEPDIVSFAGTVENISQKQETVTDTIMFTSMYTEEYAADEISGLFTTSTEVEVGNEPVSFDLEMDADEYANETIQAFIEISGVRENPGTKPSWAPL